MPLETGIPNIYIIGPQSTGKTTLVNKLQSNLESWPADSSAGTPDIISEVARSILTKHNFSAKDITSSTNRCLALQKLILEAQASAEEEALRSSQWFISDRSGFDPLVYTKRYVSTDAVADLQLEPAWREVKARMSNSLIVVCEAGTPWLLDDGVRLMPGSEQEWMQVFQDFCGILEDVGFEYSVLPRTMLDLEERAEFIRARWTERRQLSPHNGFEWLKHQWEAIAVLLDCVLGNVIDSKTTGSLCLSLVVTIPASPVESRLGDA